MSSKKKTPGFEEAPQSGFDSGAPIDIDIFDPMKIGSSFAKEVEAESEKPAPKKKAAPKKAKPAAKKPAKSARGTSLGGTHDPKKRAAAGLNPVAGMDVSLEDAKNLPANDGVTATVKALEDLIENGHPAFRAGTWEPHRPARPAKSEGGIPFNLTSPYEPKGDQPTAIADLVEGINDQDETQVLLGVTGSGK
ncbi:MAG: excinuclease ABC subunit B, partial [Devosiaceae bacterium]